MRPATEVPWSRAVTATSGMASNMPAMASFSAGCVSSMAVSMTAILTFSPLARSGFETDAVEGVVHDARRLLQVVDVVRRLGLCSPAVAGKLGDNEADRAAVGNAEAHYRHAEQGRDALRTDFEAEGGGEIGDHRGVALDGDQHLVGNEGAADRLRRDGRQRGRERLSRRRIGARGRRRQRRAVGERAGVGGLRRSSLFRLLAAGAADLETGRRSGPEV